MQRMVFDMDEEANDKAIAAVTKLLAELKALRVWRDAVVKAHSAFDKSISSPYASVGSIEAAHWRYTEAWNTAETELHDGKF